MNPQEIYKEIGQKIRYYREGNHLTQAQLAAEIGISRASLANIEAGRQQILVHYLYLTANALDLDSPIALLATSPSLENRQIESAELPLPEGGLTEKQRQEVLRLMGGVVSNQTPNTLKENK